jgi:hypothetical protein
VAGTALAGRLVRTTPLEVAIPVRG